MFNKKLFKDVMNSILWIAFIAVAITHLAFIDDGTFTNDKIVTRITKCLLVPILMGIFAVARFDTWKKEYWLVIFALLFAFLGDVLLIEWTNSKWLFLAGLGAFLIGHLFSIIYIAINSGIKKNKWKWLIIIPFIMMPLVIWQISTLKDSIVIPVSVFFYAIMLCTLLGFSITLIPAKEKRIWFPALLGSALFAISDMILGLRMFKHIHFPPITVMTTYILAQAFLLIAYLEISRYKEVIKAHKAMQI